MAKVKELKFIYKTNTTDNHENQPKISEHALEAQKLIIDFIIKRYILKADS